MTTKEYQLWMEEMERSESQWRLDEVTFSNRQEYLLFKGGAEKGVYISVDRNGIASIGNYEGAFPHIGEATFTVKHSKKLADDATTALAIVTEKLGMSFLMNLIFGI